MPPSESVRDNEPIKDKHSNDVKSTFHAPAKKNGQGGQFTWGGDTSATGDYYTPVASPQPKQVKLIPDRRRKPGLGAPNKGFQMRDSDFPTLGGGPSPQASPQMQAQQAKWQRDVYTDKDFFLI